MAPNIGKLICNNRDAEQQRNEDTDAMIDMILRKRNDAAIGPSTDTRSTQNEYDKSEDNDGMLRIAETIRDLAEKLHIQHTRYNFTQPTHMSNEFDQVHPALKPFNNENSQIDNLIHQNLIDAISKLQLCQAKESFPESTPKAGNLSSLKNKTPNHSNRNVERNIALSSPTALLYVNPNSLVSRSVDDSLENLRTKLSKAKESFKPNVGKNEKQRKLHPISPKNSSVTDHSMKGFERQVRPNKVDKATEQKPSRDSRFKVLETSLPMQKLRSLSAGRASQSAVHLFNRIARGYETVNANDSSESHSDTTQDTLPLCSPSVESEIFVNHHFNSIHNEHGSVSKPFDLVRVSRTEKNQKSIDRFHECEKPFGLKHRSATPTPKARSGSRSKSRQSQGHTSHNKDTGSHIAKSRNGPIVSNGARNTDPEKGPLHVVSHRNPEVSLHRDEIVNRLKSHRRKIERLQQEMNKSDCRNIQAEIKISKPSI